MLFPLAKLHYICTAHNNYKIKPAHDKTYKIACAPSEYSDQLGHPPSLIRIFLLSAWRKLGPLATHWTHSKDSDQTERMLTLIWVFTGRTCHFVGFVVRWLKYETFNIRCTVFILTQLAFYVNLHRAVIGPSATLTGRWRPDIDLRRILTGLSTGTFKPKQTVKILIRRRFYGRLIRVWTICYASSSPASKTNLFKVKDKFC